MVFDLKSVYYFQRKGILAFLLVLLYYLFITNWAMLFSVDLCNVMLFSCIYVVYLQNAIKKIKNNETMNLLK